MRVRAFWVFLICAVASGHALAQSSTEDRLSDPQSTVRNFLVRQTPPDIDLSVAAEGFSINPGLSEDRRGELAAQLKAVLDARGLVVHIEDVPNDPSYVDEASGLARYRLFPVRLPEISVVAQNGRWLFSRETVAATPRLYSATFSVAAQALIANLPPIFRVQLLGTALWQYTGIFLILLLAFVTRRTAEFLLRKVAKWLVAHTEPRWDEEVVLQAVKPLGFLVLTSVVWFSYADLQLGASVNIGIRFVLQLMVAGSVLWLAFRMVDFLCDYLLRITTQTETKLDDQLVPLLRKSLKLFAVTIGILVVVQSFGYSISSLLAGLGIGGVAVALAAKDTIANFFGSVVIFADRPFQIGDWIVTGNVEGTVEEVGFRSTRVRTFYNSVVSVPNSSIATSDVDNMGLRRYRRIREVLGLTYSTNASQMQAFVEGIRAIIVANRFMRKDFYEVHFNGFGGSSLNVLVYCFLDVESWTDELREKHNFFLEVLRLAEAVGVEFAFPTQTLHIDSVYADSPRTIGSKRTDEELAEAVTAFGPSGRLSRPYGPKFTHDGKPVDFTAQQGPTRGGE